MERAVEGGFLPLPSQGHTIPARAKKQFFFSPPCGQLSRAHANQSCAGYARTGFCCEKKRDWGHPRQWALAFAVTLFPARSNSDKTNRGFLTRTRSQHRLGLVARCGDLALYRKNVLFRHIFVTICQMGLTTLGKQNGEVPVVCSRCNFEVRSE